MSSFTVKSKFELRLSEEWQYFLISRLMQELTAARLSPLRNQLLCTGVRQCYICSVLFERTV